MTALMVLSLALVFLIAFLRGCRWVHHGIEAGCLVPRLHSKTKEIVVTRVGACVFDHRACQFTAGAPETWVHYLSVTTQLDGRRRGSC